MGPSVARHGVDLDLVGDFDEEEALKNELVDALVDRFPIVKDLISDQSINLNGTRSSWSAGFRYQINVGYHFGRKSDRK